MSDTPATDRAEDEWREDRARRDCQEEMAAMSRLFEARLTRAKREILELLEVNRAAADRTSDGSAATWSLGVAKGLEVAAGILGCSVGKD